MAGMAPFAPPTGAARGVLAGTIGVDGSVFTLPALKMVKKLPMAAQAVLVVTSVVIPDPLDQ